MSPLVRRVFFHGVGKPFLHRMVALYLIVLLSAAMADAVVDWNVVRHEIAQLSPWRRTALFAGLFLAFGLAAGRALRPVWATPLIAFMVRQPLNGRQWAIALLPSLSIAFLPVMALWWLAPHYAFPLLHYPGFVGLVWPIVLGGSYKGSSSVVVLGAGLVSLVLLMFAYSYYAFVAYIALAVTILQLPAAVAFIPRQVSRTVKPFERHLSSPSVVSVITRRDLRCLCRMERTTLLNLALITAIAALLMMAFRINGAVEGREALLTGCVLFSLALSTGYEGLEKLKMHLGRNIMRRSWPVTSSQRSLALVGTITVLLAPGAVLIALFGSSMGAGNLAAYVVFVAASISMSTALFSRLLAEKTNGTGLCLLLIILHTAAIFMLPVWVYAVAAILAAVTSFSLIRSGFRNFAVDVERVAFDRLA